MALSYLGPLGGLVPLTAQAAPIAGLGSSSARPMSYRTTLGGVRKAQAGQRTHRRWSVDLGQGTAPEAAATLSAFVAGEFGTGPWWWVDPWAMVTNLASPRGAALEVGDLTGATLTVGTVHLGGAAYAGRHLQLGGATVDLPHVRGNPEPVPVLPGRPVTVSAWVDGGTVAALFRNAAGGVVATSPGRAADGTGWQRVADTAVAPPSAASVQVRVSGANRTARPAITWTPHLLGYFGGQGAPAVVVDGGSGLDVGFAAPEPDGQFAAFKFTIEEVG